MSHVERRASGDLDASQPRNGDTGGALASDGGGDNIDVHRRQHVVRVISGAASEQDAPNALSDQSRRNASSSPVSKETCDARKTQDCEETSPSAEKKRISGWRRVGSAIQSHLPIQLAWIAPTVSNWPKMKPVLRSAIAAWICMLFIIITPVEQMALGRASFLILIGIFIQPVDLPFAAIVEREIFTLIFTSAAWALSCLAIFLADLSRKQKLSPAQTNVLAVLNGDYIELAPSAICALFLAIGVAFFLYLKVKFGPSPFIFATILGCITLDIALVFAPLYPYPNYVLGQSVVVPLAIKAGIAILLSATFFPKSVNSAFVERLQAVLKPMQDLSVALGTTMQKSPLDDDFDFEVVQKLVTRSEAGLAPLLGSSRLLTRELSFAMASGESLKGLVKHTRALLAPIDGVAFYFSILRADLRGLDYAHHPHASHFATPAPTQPSTPLPSRPPSRQGASVASASSDAGATDNQKAPALNRGESSALQQEVSGTLHEKLGELHAQRPNLRKRFSSNKLATNKGRGGHQPKTSRDLLRRVHETFHLHKHREHVDIGLWESLRYNAVETYLHPSRHEQYTDLCMRILARMSRKLLNAHGESYQDLSAWLLALNKNRPKRLRDWLLLRSTTLRGSLLQRSDGSPKTLNDTAANLGKVLEDFRVNKIMILEPFRGSLEEDAPFGQGQRGSPQRIPHRYLFQSLTYCYFQIEYTERILDLLRACDRLENEDSRWRIWLPTFPKFFRVETWWTHDDGDDDIGQDENPDEVPGMASSLGEAEARDPDALSSDSRFQSLGVFLSNSLHQLYRGHSLFMIKVGIVTVLVALPSYYQATAGWAYRNRAIWPLIMSQLVTARHRGEVLFGLFSRAIATFLGALIGLVIWYIAAGNGDGNPYAMAVVTAIAFTIVMLGRIHYPGPPITPIITCVTVALIVGYSWQDAHSPTPGNPGIGWAVAWRRFVEVLIGAAASYVMAVLPPSSNMRTYFRLSHATTIREAGSLFCTTVTIAANPSQRSKVPEAQAQLLAIRNKIRRLALLKGPIAFEWSLRGKWPLRRYAELEHVEMRFLRLMTHMTTIHERLEPAYSNALLSRTHFLDPLFLADCVAILSMCATSLRTRQPLPQIVPVLIDRYLSSAWGFNVKHADRDDLDSTYNSESPHFFQSDGECTPGKRAKTPFATLPQKVTFETLCDTQYQVFAVGAQIAFGLVLHLDRLCIAVKALVGETYAVSVDLEQYQYQYLLRPQ